MKTKIKSNNERLRELIEGAGLSQPAALVIFNRGLGPAGYAFTTFKAFLASPGTTKFRPFNDDLLEHAEKAFAKLQK